MWWAESGIRENKQIRLMLGLAISFGLGGLFLLIQGFEYARAGFTPQANAYGSLFYTLTGFHGLHVTVGLVLISVMQVRSWVGHFDASRYLGVQTTAMYWHFVDAVWIFIFGSLYLSPYLFPR
jgi:heme/copper-type cytochrome/quinol oxidase subunit 3